MNTKVITLDGPAAAGKTTLAGRLAQKLNIGVMNSGAMYRAATWVMRCHHLQKASESEICSAIKAANLRLEEIDDSCRLFYGDEDITDQLTDPILTREIKLVADLPMVREVLGEWQHNIVATNWKVTEGRDQGTEVFPGALVKIFLVADFDERVKRRRLQQEAKGMTYSKEQLKELSEDMAHRDKSDRERRVGALRRPEGSYLLDNSKLDLDGTEEVALKYIEETLKVRGIDLPLGS